MRGKGRGEVRGMGGVRERGRKGGGGGRGREREGGGRGRGREKGEREEAEGCCTY